MADPVVFLVAEQFIVDEPRDVSVAAIRPVVDLPLEQVVPVVLKITAQCPPGPMPLRRNYAELDRLARHHRYLLEGAVSRHAAHHCFVDSKELVTGHFDCEEPEVARVGVVPDEHTVTDVGVGAVYVEEAHELVCACRKRRACREIIESDLGRQDRPSRVGRVPCVRYERTSPTYHTGSADYQLSECEISRLDWLREHLFQLGQLFVARLKPETIKPFG